MYLPVEESTAKVTVPVACIIKLSAVKMGVEV
jgi:hypothetical protein